MSNKETAIRRHLLFSVPVFERYFPRFQEHQAGILAFIEQEMAASPGESRSNQGGWHSESQMHLSKHPDVNWLVQRIYQVASNCIQQQRSLKADEEIHMVSAWFNVNPPHSWNSPHTHLPQDWSGVFYIDISPPEDKAQAIPDGDIVFFDPMPLGEQAQRPPTVSFTPKTGIMFLFPSYLIHMVAPHPGPDNRISFAFNFRIVKKEPPGSVNNDYLS